MNEIVFVDGHCSSGKSLISKVLECYEGVEISKEDEPFQITQWLYRLGKIDKSTCITLFKIWADRYIYNQMIGRNINSRKNDITSLHKYPNKNKYLDRMESSEEHDTIIERINKEKPIFQQMTQNALIEGDVYFEAFSSRLKIIYINRNKQDVINGIMKSNFGTRIGKDPTEISISIDYKGDSIPYYAKGWPNEYLKMSPNERITKWIDQETDMVNKMYNNLTEYKDNIMFINFEDFVTSPYKWCEIIGKFIGRKPKDNLNKVLKEQNCPRIL